MEWRRPTAIWGYVVLWKLNRCLLCFPCTPVCVPRHKCSPDPAPAVGPHVSHWMIPREEMYQWGFLASDKVMWVSEIAMEWPALSYPRGCESAWGEILCFPGLLPLCPWGTQIIPHPWRGVLPITATQEESQLPPPVLVSHQRSSLTSPRLSQLCKQGTIICDYAFLFLVGFL